MSPKVCVLVLNRNGKLHLEYCLPSMLATQYDNLEIILVDNASTDNSVEYTRANYASILILQNATNLGWAAGNNAGIALALKRGADYIVLQNNDTQVDPRWIAGAVEACSRDPRVGLVGFNMLQEYVQGEDPDQQKFNALSAAWHKLEIEPATHVTGAALFVRADVYRDVGPIDEAYFAYGEEDDLEKRAMRAGYAMVRINVPLWHYNGGFWRDRLFQASVLAMRNNVRVMLKNETRREMWRQLRWMIRFVCSPGVKFDPNVPHFRRLRPSNFVVNSLILAYACVWNLVMLPATLRARRADERRIREARRRWSPVGVF